jgi:hypothetical protein
LLLAEGHLSRRVFAGMLRKIAGAAVAGGIGRARRGAKFDDDDAETQVEVSKNSVGKAALLRILSQREAELVGGSNHEKPFALTIGRELPICKPPGVSRV